MNNHVYCDAWASGGECSINQWMLENCKLSCNICDVITDITTTTAQPTTTPTTTTSTTTLTTTRSATTPSTTTPPPPPPTTTTTPPPPPTTTVSGSFGGGSSNGQSTEVHPNDFDDDQILSFFIPISKKCCF